MYLFGLASRTVFLLKEASATRLLDKLFEAFIAAGSYNVRVGCKVEAQV